MVAAHPQVRSAGPVSAIAAILLITVGGSAWSLSVYAEGARAGSYTTDFGDEFSRCQLLLNTVSGPSSHVTRGIALAKKALEEYGVEQAGDWMARPNVRRLPEKDRLALREEMAELLLLTAPPKWPKLAANPTRSPLQCAARRNRPVKTSGTN